MTNLRPVERGVQSRPYLALQGDPSTVVRLLLAGRPLCKEACWKRLLDAGDFAQCLVHWQSIPSNYGKPVSLG